MYTYEIQYVVQYNHTYIQYVISIRVFRVLTNGVCHIVQSHFNLTLYTAVE